MNKKYFSLLLLLLMFSNTFLFSQNRRIRKFERELSNERYLINREDDIEERKAMQDPIIRKICDTLGYEYIKQHFYHSGNLYMQVFYMNNEKVLYEKYHPNKQLYCRKIVRSLKDEYDLGDDLIHYNRFGDYQSVTKYATYNDIIYEFSTRYGFLGELYHLYVHYYEGQNEKGFNIVLLAAEFRRENGKWEPHIYHGKPVPFADKLLELYINEIEPTIKKIEDIPEQDVLKIYEEARREWAERKGEWQSSNCDEHILPPEYENALKRAKKKQDEKINKLLIENDDE